MSRRGRERLVPGADLDGLKYEVAEELAYFPRGQAGEPTYSQHLDRLKYEVAQELGIPLTAGYNGEITSRQAGRIGGRIGGPIGGGMVRRMIRLARESMTTR